MQPVTDAEQSLLIPVVVPDLMDIANDVGDCSPVSWGEPPSWGTLPTNEQMNAEKRVPGFYLCSGSFYCSVMNFSKLMPSLICTVRVAFFPSFHSTVMEYDPGSRHAKEAGKALQDPEIANAKPASSGQPAPQPHQ